MSSDINLDSLDEDGGDVEIDEGETPLAKHLLDFCGGPDLIEIFGPSGSGKSVFTVELVKSVLAHGDKDVLFIDTERNVGDLDEISGADYVYIPEWLDIYAYITGKKHKLSDDPFGENTTNSNQLEDGYDMVVLDSMGFPALVQYADYRIEDDSSQFQVFLEIQHITGKLKQYSQRNNALVAVINQPKSALSGESDPKPFGDKSIFGFKEIWKTVRNSTNETATRCTIQTYRSRQAGRGTGLYELKIDNSGVEVSILEEEEGGGWM